MMFMIYFFLHDDQKPLLHVWRAHGIMVFV